MFQRGGKDPSDGPGDGVRQTDPRDDLLDEEPPSESDQGQRFTQLFTELLPELRDYVRGRVLPHDVDDILDDVMLVAWRHWEDVPALSNEGRAWVFAVAKRIIANSYRTRARHLRLLDALATTTSPTTGPGTEEHLVADAAVDDLLADLPAEQREVVRLILVEGLSHQEAAAALGISITAATSRLHRARRALIEIHTNRRTGGDA